jgi:3-oxoacyl-[acyl-carrier-protein] synthase-1
MKSQLLSIVGSGMVSGVGFTAPASCAAIRCGKNNFQETRFMDSGGEWIIGSSVPTEQPWRGISKLAKMLASVLRECIVCEPVVNINEVPVLLCLAEEDRPGRLHDLNNQVLLKTQKELDVHFHENSDIVAYGRVSVAIALNYARKLIYDGGFARVIIAGVDSLLVGPVLQSYEGRKRLLTKNNSNGFIPGEAAAAVLVQMPKRSAGPELVCTGIGEGLEEATVDAEDVPLRADGMLQAIRNAMIEARCKLGDLDFRISDVSGEQYGFKEAALALTRLLRQRKEEFDIWHPADCIGEVGAVIGPVILSVLLAGMYKGYCPGQKTIAHFGNDDGKRAALVMSYESTGGGQ